MTYQASINHSFDVKLAIQLESVELAIVVYHFQYWINKNQELNNNFIDGRTWTYQTREAIAACMPYFSPDQIRRFTDKLVDLKILKKGNYNEHSMDKTIWYAFENEEMFTIGKIAKSNGKIANGAGKIAKAIPNTIPNTITNNVVCSEHGSHQNESQNNIKLQHIDGHFFDFSLNEIFTYAVNSKENWSTEEINEAFLIVKSYKNPIRCPFAFISGTIKKIRNKKHAEFIDEKIRKTSSSSNQKNKFINENDMMTKREILERFPNLPQEVIEFLQEDIKNDSKEESEKLIDIQKYILEKKSQKKGRK